MRLFACLKAVPGCCVLSTADVKSMCCTHSYAPPEVLGHIAAGNRPPYQTGLAVDLWSLGIMLHEVFTCTRPNWKTAFAPSRSSEEAGAIFAQQELWVPSFPPEFAFSDY